jgi:hypothetical protein
MKQFETSFKANVLLKFFLMLYETPLYTACLPFYAPIRRAALNFFRKKYRVSFYGMKKSRLHFVAGKPEYSGAYLPYIAWEVSYQVKAITRRFYN